MAYVNQIKSFDFDCYDTGQNIKTFIRRVSEAPTESNEVKGLYEFGGHTIKDSIKQRNKAPELCKQFCAKVVENLESKFDPTGDSAFLSVISNILTPN